MKKIRHIIAERLFAPKRCCDGQNERAIAFKKIIAESSLANKLDAQTSVKAMQSLGQSISSGAGTNKQTYEDTDNKKRDFGGDLPPGLDSKFGYIFETARDGKDENYSLKLLSRKSSREGIKNQPNFGWVKRGEGEPKKDIKNKPQIVIRKYKVNQKTDEIIPSSEEIINPFARRSGIPFDNKNIPRPKSLDSNNPNIKTKSLPGRPLKSRIPGGSLIGRAAAAIGIIRDANNKFRCQPGTPAANQFTDMYGATCFGFSPTRFGKYVHEKAMELTDAGEMQGFKSFVNKARNWLDTGSWSEGVYGNIPINRGIDSATHHSRALGWDPVSGTSVKPDWDSSPVPRDMRVFANGAKNAQRRMEQANKAVEDLAKALGVDTSKTARATNSDLDEVFQTLRATGQWDV
ncbi:MAG: hypothetical protein EB023_13515, partial [Flavobacteriia bacterium]|nr:hypothetical protein [Flavobacteriia bacterium]